MHASSVFCFIFDRIFVLIPKFSFFQGCLLTGCLNGGFCVFDKKEHLFSCSCKIPWTGKKCENKNGKINLFYFFKWKRSDHCNQEDFTAISDKSVVLNLEVPQFTDH